MITRPICSITKPPGVLEDRVFIGGTFTYVSILEEIYKTVLDCGFTPIYSLDFGIPFEETRHYSARLVQQCRIAVFETSLDGGWFFEMEDALKYSLLTLCVWDAYPGILPRISAMALTHDVFTRNNKSYKTIEELRSIVTKFLNGV